MPAWGWEGRGSLGRLGLGWSPPRGCTGRSLWGPGLALGCGGWLGWLTLPRSLGGRLRWLAPLTLWWPLWCLGGVRLCWTPPLAWRRSLGRLCWRPSPLSGRWSLWGASPLTLGLLSGLGEAPLWLAPLALARGRSWRPRRQRGKRLDHRTALWVQDGLPVELEKGLGPWGGLGARHFCPNVGPEDMATDRLGLMEQPSDDRWLDFVIQTG